MKSHSVEEEQPGSVNDVWQNIALYGFEKALTKILNINPAHRAKALASLRWMYIRLRTTIQQMEALG